jgi:hypothetical protein
MSEQDRPGQRPASRAGDEAVEASTSGRSAGGWRRALPGTVPLPAGSPPVMKGRPAMAPAGEHTSLWLRSGESWT